MNGFHGLEANDEANSDDRTSLLSERAAPNPSLQAQLPQPPEEWRREQEGRNYRPDMDPMYGAMPPANPSYGAMPPANPGYPDYAGPGAYGAAPGAYGSGPGAYGAPIGGGYAGRYAENSPYGGLLEPSRPQGGSLLDYAPQPLQAPPPQYYQQSQAYGRAPGMPPY